MDITRQERKELDALSLEVFGVSSKWQRFFKGIPELITKTVVETIPGEKDAPDTTREVQVPVLIGTAKQYKTRAYSIQEVRDLLLNAKKQRDIQLAKFKELEELKKVEQQVQELGSGQTL